MGESEIHFVEAQGFAIDFVSVSAPMTIRTERNQIVVFMRPTCGPGDNVMDVNVDISTRGDGAAVSSLDKDPAAKFSRYRRASVIHGSAVGHPFLKHGSYVVVRCDVAKQAHDKSTPWTNALARVGLVRYKDPKWKQGDIAAGPAMKTRSSFDYYAIPRGLRKKTWR
jgi:hypothetical protein